MSIGNLDYNSAVPGSTVNLMPWLDYATASVPNNHQSVLWWAEYLWFSNDAYRSSLSRVADHFLTEIDFPDEETDEENEYRDLFENSLGYRLSFKMSAEELLAYGTLVTSVFQPFDRYMVCPDCKMEQPFKRAKPKVALNSAAPHVEWRRGHACPKCGSMTPFICKDRPSRDVTRINLVRYPPRHLDLMHNAISGRTDVRIRPSWPFFQDIRTRADIFIEDTPLEVLEAAAMHAPLLLEPEQTCVIAIPALSGLNTRGWGIAPSIASFRSAWLNQMFNKADQAIAADYTLGMRIVSPATTAGGEDPMKLYGMQTFQANFAKITATHRNDPSRYYAVPHPMNYQFLGGEGANLLPPDKLKFRQQEFLNGMGIPVQFYQMDLTTHAAPMAIRLFENAWQVVPAVYNKLLDFVVGQVAHILGKEKQRAIMRRTTLADDSERKAILGQLMAANQISPQTFLEAFGINASAEVKKVYRHQAFVAKTQKEFDQKAQDEQEMGALSAIASNPTPSTIAAQMQQTAQGPGGGLVGAPGGGGAPPGPGGQGGPQALPEMSAQAEQLAQQLVPMPEAQRKQQLKQIRESSKDLHALVMAAMDRLRSSARSQGQQAMIQQMGQGQPAA